MLSKETKIRVLENFYAIDYVLFGRPIIKTKVCCPLVKEEYLSIKGALLSVFIEMAKLIEHTPPLLQERINSSVLRSLAKKSAKVARENARQIVTSSKAKNDIKVELKESLSRDKSLDIAKLVESKIREKAFSLALDNLLVARLLSESKNMNKLNEWEGKIIEDSYKILRDNLVESAVQIIYGEEN